MEEITLPVNGMTCGGCAASLERALRRTPGVRQARVSFDSGQAIVEYDPAHTDPQRLAAAVTDAGFGVARFS